MNDAQGADTLTRTLSSASEISYVDYDTAKKLMPRAPMEFNTSLLSSAPGLTSHGLVAYAPPLVKETRQERSSSVLIGELESNCNTVSRLASLISTDSQAMSKYVEQAKHTLSLSASANSVAALGNMKAILDGVSDSSTGSTGNSDKQTDLPDTALSKSGHRSSVNISSTREFTESLGSKQPILYQQQSDTLSHPSVTVSTYALTPTGKQASPSGASPLQTTFCAKEICQGDVHSTVTHSLGPYTETPEPTFMRPHSVSLQSILSTGQAHLRPPPIRELPDEVIVPPTVPQQEILSSLPKVSHCAAPSASLSRLPWKPGTTVQIDNLPLPTVEDYFSSIEHLDNLFINKIDPGKYFPIDEGYLQRLQYEISAIRRYMNLNISARDAELARLGKEIRSLKLDREQRASSLKEGAIPNNLHYQSSQKMHIDDSAVKVVFPSPFSINSNAVETFLEPGSTEISNNDHENKYSTPLTSSDLGALIVTPEMIENCFSSISNTLPGVSLVDTSGIPESYTKPPTTLAPNKQQTSESPDLIKEYTTGNLAELKVELARTREEAMQIIKEKDAEIMEMRRNLAAVKSMTSATTSAAISLISTLPDKTSSITEEDIRFGNRSTSDRVELPDKCNTPLPRPAESDSLQVSALPVSSTAILASVTHPEDTCSSLSPASVQTIVHSGSKLRPSLHYSISVSSTSDTCTDRSISLTEDQSSLSSKLTTSKLGTSHLKLALSTVAKSGTIPPKPPPVNTFLPLAYSTDTPLHDDYLPSPSSSRSDSVEAAPSHPLMVSGSHTPMSASPAQTVFEQNKPAVIAPAGPHVTFLAQESLVVPQASRAPEPLASSGSLMSNSSYLYDMDTGDQRDDDFLKLEQEVRATQSLLIRSLASTGLSDTYRSSDFAGVVIDTFSAPHQTAVLP